MTWTTKTRGRARAFLPTIAVLVASAGFAACGDDDDIVAVIPTTAVTTFNDASFNFSTLKTFAMPDTVVHFAPLTGTPLAVSRQFDQVALNQVRADLIARGYVQVTAGSGVTPSFVVLVGATATTNCNAVVGYPWYGTWGFYSGWAFYAPGFDTSWGIVYPWYTTTGVVAYDRGTLIVDLIPTGPTINPLTKTIRSVWAGVATTLLDGNVTAAGVSAAIDQMFALSPYLTAVP